MHKSTVMVGLVNESVCCVQLETMNAVVSGTAVSYAAFGVHSRRLRCTLCTIQFTASPAGGGRSCFYRVSLMSSVIRETQALTVSSQTASVTR